VLRQILPGVSLSKAALLPPVRVGRESVVSAALDVDGTEVEGDGMGHLKQPLSQLLVHDLVGHILLGRSSKEASENGVDPALLHKSPWREESLAKRKVALVYGRKVRTETGQDWVHHGVAKPAAESMKTNLIRLTKARYVT
jgi:hypothetical protein